MLDGCEYKQETLCNILLNEILKGLEILSFLVNSADAESEFNSKVKEIALMVQFPVDTVQRTSLVAQGSGRGFCVWKVDRRRKDRMETSQRGEQKEIKTKVGRT
jgi:hypothetical protein